MILYPVSMNCPSCHCSWHVITMVMGNKLNWDTVGTQSTILCIPLSITTKLSKHYFTYATQSLATNYFHDYYVKTSYNTKIELLLLLLLLFLL